MFNWLFHILIFATSGKYQNKEKPLKHQRKLRLVGIHRGGQGVRTPLKNHKNIGFLSNTGSDLLNKCNATKSAFNVGPTSARQRNTI